MYHGFQCWKTDEVENANFLFKNKPYVDAILRKLQAKERGTQRVRLKNVIQKW